MYIYWTRWSEEARWLINYNISDNDYYAYWTGGKSTATATTTYDGMYWDDVDQYRQVVNARLVVADCNNYTGNMNEFKIMS